jgi:hypothetical protein
MYADETGDLDMTGARGSSTYFGFGTAVYSGEHGHALWQGLQLRCALEENGVNVPRGLHAKNDSHATRNETFDLIRSQQPRFDTTFLRASWLLGRCGCTNWRGTSTSKRSQGRWALLATLCTSLLPRSRPIGRRVVPSAKEALADVVSQFAARRRIVLCVWEAASSWGIQVADYGLWATQRVLEGRPCPWYATSVAPTLRSRFTPWGENA